MDPITIALAALSAGGAGYNYYEQNNLNRAQSAFGQAQGNAEIRAAENARAQQAEDIARRRRQLQEALAARGVEDSTIATDDMNYLNRGAQRQEQAANDRVDLAHRGLALFKKKVRSGRRSNYVNLGLGLAGALGGAYAGMNAAPAPTSAMYQMSNTPGLTSMLGGGIAL